MILRKLARDSLIYGGSEFLFKVIAFWTFPLIAAQLSPQAFGTLELTLTATTLLGLVANCGLNNALQRFYWDAQTLPEQKPVLVSSGLAGLCALLLVAITLGILALLIFSYTTKFVGIPLGWVGLLAALLLMAAGQVVGYLLDVTRLNMAPWRFVGVALLSRVMTAGAGLASVLWLSWGVDGLLAAQALVMIGTIPLALYGVRSDLTRHIDFGALRRLLHFGYPFIYTGLAFWLFGTMDRWMLASMSGIEEVGVFSVANRFASVILFVSMAFGLAWSPFSIKIRTDYPHEYRALYVDVLIALMCIMLLLGGGIALFAPEVLAWLMPAEYRSAGLALSVLSLGLILQSSMQVTALGISLEGKTYLFARLSWVSVFLNFILNLFLIPKFGALGAALATALCYLYLTGSYLFFTQRLHRLPLNWGKMALLAVLFLMMAMQLVGISFENPLAMSLMSRTVLMLLILLFCMLLIPWRRAFDIERSVV